MKKIAEFLKKKRTYFKAISMILVLALMVQTVSIAVTAISESGLSIDEMVSFDGTVPIDDSLETMPSIVGEVESCRDQYTKVYELSDGSFYEVISNDPIHENVNGQWQEPSNNLDVPESVDEVTSYCDELVDSISEEQNDGGVSTFSFNVNDVEEHVLSYAYVANIEDGTLMDNKRLVTDENYLLVKIDDSLLSLSNTNQITVKQRMFIACNDPYIVDSESAVYAHAISEPWCISDENHLAIPNDDGSTTEITGEEVYYQESLLDSFGINSNTAQCEFDITETCHKWRKGTLDNNGLLFYISGDSASVTIGNCYITRRYLVVDAYDPDFTYHSIDMGDAGQVFVNDLTNTVTIQKNEIYFPSGAMPINLYRYFDFSKTYITSNPAGNGSHWNYECPLVNESSYVTSWEAFDGRTIRFTRDNISQDEWTCDQNERYVLDTSDADILDDNYYNAKIISPDNLTYTFGSKGKIIKIEDDKGNYIVVKYNGIANPTESSPQDYITSIENNSGYKYEFVYGYDYDLDETTTERIFSLTKIVYKKFDTSSEEYNTVNIDSTPIEISYSYTRLPNGNLALNKVFYPHSQSEEPLTVEYHYDDNGRLTTIYNTDKRKLEISYTKTLEEFLYIESEDVYVDKTLDNYPSAFSFKEYVLNDDYSANTQDVDEYLLKSSIDIDRVNTYHRVFENESSKKESIHYSRMFELLYYINDSGNNYFVDYKVENENRYISQIVTPENKTSLNDNAGFESGKLNSKPSNWGELGGSGILKGIKGDLDGQGKRIAQLQGSVNDERAATQFVSLAEAEIGDVIVVGGNAESNSAVSTASHFFGIEVYKAIVDTYGSKRVTDELLYRLDFDSTMDNEPQFRLGAFKLNEDIDLVQFRLVYSYQTGTAYFDNALIYITSDDNVTFWNAPSTENSDDENNSDEPSGEENPDNDNIYEDVLSDGTTQMISKYEYSPTNNYLIKHTDHNNVITNYAYDSNTGLLSQKSVKINDNLSALIDNYSYDATGALKEVTRVIDSVQNTTGATYTYEYGKISSVVHNNMTYRFDYNSYGELKSIVMETDSNEAITLVSYDYTPNTNTITYSNGKVLKYVCDDKGRVTSIYDCSASPSPSEPIYSYTYGDNGEPNEIWDYNSGRVIVYSNNLFEVYGLSENSDDIDDAELLYSRQIGADETETYKTFSAEYSKTSNEPIYNDTTKKTTYASNTVIGGDYPITYESQAVSDYFGRITSSSVSYTPENSQSTHSIVNESVYMNNPDNTATTNLLKTYTAKIMNENSSSNSELNKFISRYEYDYAGRITHIYYNANNVTEEELAYYYEYDFAGQLTKEADFLGTTYTEYIYDTNGNIIQKKVYSGENSFVYRYGTVSPASGAEAEIINYYYNEIYGDVLERYDGNYISMDEYGNPLKYHGKVGGTLETFILTWDGNQLRSVKPEDDDSIYEYKYDEEGRRTKKIAYSNVTNNYPEGRVLERTTDYIWDDDKIVGYRIRFENEGSPITVEAIIIYNELNIPVGMKYSLDCVTSGENSTELAEEDVFWFIKDGQGNVKAIYSENTKFTIGCSYTSDGDFSINVSEDFVTALNERIDGIDDTKTAILTALLYAISIQSASMLSIDASQSTHYNYIMDNETGLYYCQNRYYSPEYGRFINVDSFERVMTNLDNPFNANPFVYFNNDPINCKSAAYSSNSNGKVVGMQADLSHSLLSFADSVGIEFVYDSVKDKLYAYYYGDANSNYDYKARAIKKIQKTLSEVSVSENISLKSLATILKIKNSVSVSYFATQTNKNFAWPSSYLGVARIISNKTNGYSGYNAYGNGYHSKGICYYPTSNLGFVSNNSSVKYTKVDIDSPVLKNYLSSNQNNIIDMVK